jgi:hypothetical protein
VWRSPGGLPEGSGSGIDTSAQQLVAIASGIKMVPHNFHWLFLSALILWSEQYLKARATLAFCGLFLGEPIFNANVYYGISSQAFFPGVECRRPADGTLTCKRTGAPHLSFSWGLGSCQKMRGTAGQAERASGRHCSGL